MRRCDLCLDPPVAADVTEAAQKALSAVHRLGGRFGRGRVVDHLLGKTKDAFESETRLSTFGIGRELSAGGWRDLLDQLLFEGLLREDPNDGQPLIGLGDMEAVRAVYRGERRVSMRRMPAADARAEGRARNRQRKRQGGGERPGHRGRRMPPLFEALRAWRRERAAEQKLPPYVIFHDTTLPPSPAAPRQRRRPGQDQRRRPDQAGALRRRRAEAGAAGVRPSGSDTVAADADCDMVSDPEGLTPATQQPRLDSARRFR